MGGGGILGWNQKFVFENRMSTQEQYIYIFFLISKKYIKIQDEIIYLVLTKYKQNKNINNCFLRNFLLIIISIILN